MELVARLDEQRYEVSLAVGPESGGEGSLLKEMSERGLSVVVIPSLRRAPEPGADVRALRTLSERLHRERPHIIHTHGSKSKMLAPLAASVAHTPVRVAHIWGWEWMPATGSAQRCACRWGARLSAQGYDALIACSDAMRRQGLAQAVGEPGQYEVVLPAVDLDRFTPDGDAATGTAVRAEFGLPPDVPVVVSVMRLARQKAPEVLLGAATVLSALLPDLHWLIIGGGELDKQVREMVDRLGLEDRVVLAGPRRDVPRLLRACDIFALSSRWEPFGIVYLEAAAAGLPVVGTRVDGAPEAVADGETGLLVEADSPTKLATAIARLATDPALARQMAEAGLRRAQQFGYDRFVGRIEQIYERLLAEKLDGA
jgi:glycosyltransferase involved in cell wall biosynthesis